MHTRRRANTQIISNLGFMLGTETALLKSFSSDDGGPGFILCGRLVTFAFSLFFPFGLSWFLALVLRCCGCSWLINWVCNLFFAGVREFLKLPVLLGFIQFVPLISADGQLLVHFSQNEFPRRLMACFSLDHTIQYFHNFYRLQGLPCAGLFEDMTHWLAIVIHPGCSIDAETRML